MDDFVNIEGTKLDVRLEDDRPDQPPGLDAIEGFAFDSHARVRPSLM